MTNITVTEINKVLQESLPVEIVERKGRGHPDTLCNTIVDEISNEYSKYCIKHFGKVLHHNFDKALLAAGTSEPYFGGGKIVKPITLILGDRATVNYGSKFIPVYDIAEETYKNVMQWNVKNIQPKFLAFDSKILGGSDALQDVFARNGKFLPANDTSAGVGYAPLSKLEIFTIELESLLNSPNIKYEFPFIGDDIKVMAIRKDNTVDLTVSIAMVDKYIDNEQDYFKKKDAIKNTIDDIILDEYGYKVDAHINALDRKGYGTSGIYMTVTGTSLEGGDSGQVGRGNNPYGIIPMMRPVSMEAAAGKNPVSHIGRIYNHLCFRIADEIHKVTGNPEVYVWMVSRIGTPINEPSIVNVHMAEETHWHHDLAETIVETELKNLDTFCHNLIFGEPGEQ